MRVMEGRVPPRPLIPPATQVAEMELDPPFRSIEGTRAQYLGLEEVLVGANVVMVTQQPALHFQPVQGVLVEAFAVQLAGFPDVTGVTWILRTFLGIDLLGQIPGFLIGQAVGLADRHIVLDEAGQGEQTGNTRTPVVGIITPHRREHHLATGLQAAAVL